MITVESLSAGYDEKVIVKDVSFEAEVGDFIGIVGPNGCGKTTLLKALLGLITVHGGFVKIRGKDVQKIRRGDLAKKVSFVPQLMEPIDGFTVEDTVMLGRIPHIKRFAFESGKDYKVVDKAIEQLRIGELKDIPVSNLSGGEFRRVAIARALAQNSKVMILDEPISHLDLRFKLRILRMLRKLRQDKCIIATFHDLNMASRFCRKVMLLNNKGEVVAFGWPKDILTHENLKKVYRVNVNVRKNPKTGKLRIQLP
ncbi:ABC transporter ATP-binding protein [Candidatus Margulisiibacteriota bacterium]